MGVMHKRAFLSGLVGGVAVSAGWYRLRYRTSPSIEELAPPDSASYTFATYSSFPSARGEPGFFPCLMEKVHNARWNCGSSCGMVFIGDDAIEGLTSRWCYTHEAGTDRCSGGSAYCPLKNDEGGRAFREGFPWSSGSLILGGAGDYTAQTLFMLEKVLPVLRPPKVYSVLIGTHNIPLLTHPLDVSQPFEGIRTIVGRLQREHPGTKVLVHAVLPRADDSPAGNRSEPAMPSQPWQDRVNELNQALAVWARLEGPAVEFVNCSGAFPEVKDGLAEFMPDLFHLNGAGYLRWFKCWEDVAQRVMAGSASPLSSQ